MICTNASTIREYLDGGRAAILEVMDRGRVTREDVLFLQREIFQDGIVTQEEASALFAIERTVADKAAEWTAFFIEAITAHVVWQTRPTGIVNDAKGEWLIEKVDRCRTLNALAALVNVTAEAHRMPTWFRNAVRARASRDWPGAEEALAAADAEAAALKAA
jgi:hypothetical protein